MTSSDPSETERALATAFRILAQRGHSEAELARKLSLRGISGPVATATLDRLRQSGYLDDRRFAREWAESALRNGRGFGARIRNDLVRHGISRDLAGEVMAELASEWDEEAVAAELVAKRFPVPDQSMTERERQRIAHYLLRRGFSYSAIRKALGMHR